MAGKGKVQAIQWSAHVIDGRKGGIYFASNQYVAMLHTSIGIGHCYHYGHWTLGALLATKHQGVQRCFFVICGTTWRSWLFQMP